MNQIPRPLTHAQLLALKRWNTPTIYNGWEQFTKGNPGTDAFNVEECHDFMPEMGPMVGYALTVVIEPSNPVHKKTPARPNSEYREYVASIPGPKIVVMQDLDKPRCLGAVWGEVNSNIHKALGCVGVIVDGAIRDIEGMHNAGFKALARRLCVGHAFGYPIKWDCEVEVFGRKIVPGQLIHADRHGFMAIPPGEETRLFEAAAFTDQNECNTFISAARASSGKTTEEILESLNQASVVFKDALREKFRGK